MREKEVVCPVCWGEKELTQGQIGRDKSGNFYSITWQAKCSTCYGKGKGDFDVTPEQIRSVLDRMIEAQRRLGREGLEVVPTVITSRR